MSVTIYLQTTYPETRVLPAHLYDRIKASAGEHGGIGRGMLFSDDGFGPPFGSPEGTPWCAHGHAWGTKARFRAALLSPPFGYAEPELCPYITMNQNDCALALAGVRPDSRISFARWCELLHVERAAESLAESEQVLEMEMAVA